MSENLDGAKKTKNDQNSNLNIGVVGCGYWGPKLARNFHDIPGATVVMTADLRADRLEEIQALYPDLTTTQNYADMLNSDIDAVVVATPVNTHYPLARQALLAGKHVLVEKPITSRKDHAQELVDIAAQRGLTLMVGHTFEYNPAVETVRDIVKSGDLGKILYAYSTRVNLGLLQPDINVMWDLAPHDISMLRFILGVDPVKASAKGAVYINTSHKLHEIVYLNLLFDGGVFCQSSFKLAGSGKTAPSNHCRKL